MSTQASYDTNPNLSSLDFDTGKLVPEFDPEVKQYTLQLPVGTRSILMDSAPWKESGLVYVGNILIDDTAPRLIPLSSEITSFTLNTRAQDHTTATQYIVNIVWEETVPVDKAALIALIASAPTDDSLWTEGSWQAFRSALTVATVVAGNDNSTQEDVDNALSALQAAITGLVPIPVQDPSLLLYLNFDNNTVNAQVGRATAVGTISFAAGMSGGRAASFTNTANTYITLQREDGTPLLRGLSEYTVSFWVRPTNNRTGWWWYAARNASSQVGGSERYVGILTNTGNVTYERFNGGRTKNIATKAARGITLNKWYLVTIVNGTN